MDEIFYLDRLDEWLKIMTGKEIEELNEQYLTDTQVHIRHYMRLYEKGLELIRNEPHPKQLLLKILDEYQERLEDIPDFNSSSIEDDTLDERTKENLKSLILFGTQASLIKENSRIQAQLRKTNRDYQDLLSIVTHEIKNSLTSIYGYNRIIRKRAEEGRTDQVGEVARQVDRLSRHLFYIVDTLLNMAQIDQQKLQPVKNTIKIIEDVITPVVHEMELSLSEKGMAVEVISKEDDVPLEGDDHLLQVVLRNLLLNAVQYGKPKTDVEIHVEKVRDRLLVDVFNHGEGLEKKHLKHIFNKFARFSQKRSKRHVGVGLYTVAHIVEMHQGSIKAESEPGRWMRFIISLPI
ncbi:MAG: sensor histidine kinase [Calditrichaeota bacterium]|nr:MAG: sensor histidine kinase [Calditrichota bacterium]